MSGLKRKMATLAAAALMSGPALAAIDFNEDFEGLDAASPTALSDTSWLVFGIVFSDFPGCSAYEYQYGPFGAPNGGPGFSSVVDTGTNQLLNIYNNYDGNDAHPNGKCVEASVFQERTFAAADAGNYEFKFDTLIPPENGADPTVPTFGFVKLLDPQNNYNADIFLTVDTATAGAKTVAVTLDATADGKILQWGFASKASNYLDSGRWYDNVSFGLEAVEPPPVDPPPVDPPPSDGTVSSIPTLDGWGQLAMLLALAGLGLVALNRRGL